MNSRLQPFLIPALLSLFFFCSGCSPNHLIANYYIVKAENTVDKANGLKSKKVPFEQRATYYGTACLDFVKAYEKDINVFTLNRIEMASDTCWKAGKNEERDFFNDFEADYIKSHPQEFEHGDSGVAMIDMGG